MRPDGGSEYPEDDWILSRPHKMSGLNGELILALLHRAGQAGIIAFLQPNANLSRLPRAPYTIRYSSHFADSLAELSSLLVSQ